MKEKKTGMFENRRTVLGSFPVSGWLYAVATVVYCEILLHLWVAEEVVPGRFAAVLAFALGFGGLLGQIASFLGHKKWGKWVNTALVGLVSVLYIVEFFVNDAYMSFMPMGTLLGGVYAVDEIPTVIEKVMLWYKENGYAKERLGAAIDRLGTDVLEAAIAGNDLLDRKEAILAAPVREG